jgi:Mor family transcriptional regulator
MKDEIIKKILLNGYNDKILYPFNNILDTAGYEALSSILEEFGGTSLYIPTKRTVFNICIKQQVKKEFNGNNYRELAKKYEFSERSIRNIINK